LKHIKLQDSEQVMEKAGNEDEERLRHQREEEEEQQRAQLEAELNMKFEIKVYEEIGRKAREEAVKSAVEEEEQREREEEERQELEANKREREAKKREELEREERQREAARLEVEKKEAEQKARKSEKEANRVAAAARERAEREEIERRVRWETERVARREAVARAREEAERRQKEEADLRAREEAEAKAREEARRREVEEMERIAREEEERRRREEAERLAQELAEMNAREEAERRAREEEARKQREEEGRKRRQKEEEEKREKAEIKAKEQAKDREVNCKEKDELPKVPTQTADKSSSSRPRGLTGPSPTDVSSSRKQYPAYQVEWFSGTNNGSAQLWGASEAPSGGRLVAQSGREKDKHIEGGGEEAQDPSRRCMPQRPRSTGDKGRSLKAHQRVEHVFEEVDMGNVMARGDGTGFSWEVTALEGEAEEPISKTKLPKDKVKFEGESSKKKDKEEEEKKAWIGGKQTEVSNEEIINQSKSVLKATRRVVVEPPLCAPLKTYEKAQNANWQTSLPPRRASTLLNWNKAVDATKHNCPSENIEKTS